MCREICFYSISIDRTSDSPSPGVPFNICSYDTPTARWVGGGGGGGSIVRGPLIQILFRSAGGGQAIGLCFSVVRRDHIVRTEAYDASLEKWLSAFSSTGNRRLAAMLSRD